MRWLVWMGRRLRASDGAWSGAACRSSPLGVGAARARCNSVQSVFGEDPVHVAPPPSHPRHPRRSGSWLTWRHVDSVCPEWCVFPGR